MWSSPNDPVHQLRAKGPRLPNSTVRYPPTAAYTGRSPERAAPDSCMRGLGRIVPRDSTAYPSERSNGQGHRGEGEV